MVKINTKHATPFPSGGDDSVFLNENRHIPDHPSSENDGLGGQVYYEATIIHTPVLVSNRVVQNHKPAIEKERRSLLTSDGVDELAQTLGMLSINCCSPQRTNTAASTAGYDSEEEVAPSIKRGRGSGDSKNRTFRHQAEMIPSSFSPPAAKPFAMGTKNTGRQPDTMLGRIDGGSVYNPRTKRSVPVLRSARLGKGGKRPSSP